MPGIAKTQQLLKEQFGNVNDKVCLYSSLGRATIEDVVVANSFTTDSAPA
jgi:hypothetical protein